VKGMDAIDFLKSIYLGDRGCKSILVDGWASEVKVEVTCISRVRGESWDFYSAEDMPNGYLVFEGVKGVLFEPAGLIPNDSINEVRAHLLMNDKSKYLFIMNVDSVDAVGEHRQVEIKIYADSIALEGREKPGERIYR
jgi:hypothetical protein